MQLFCRQLGSLIVAIAVALLAASFFYPMHLGGDVWGGKVENGRYFVVAKGHRYTEVSQTQWQIEQHVESAFPWLPVMLLWLGLALRETPDAKEQPVAKPSAKEALQTLLIVVLIVVGTGVMAVARCIQCGVPWTLGLGIWLPLWVSFFVVTWRYRTTHPPPAAEPDDTADPAGV